MKARLPKSWETLPQREKKIITDLMQKTVNDTIDEEEDIIQKIWLQWACLVLHDSLNCTRDDLMIFLGSWKRYYRKNRTFKNDEEQKKFLEERINTIFEGDYPKEFVNSL